MLLADHQATLVECARQQLRCNCRSWLAITTTSCSCSTGKQAAMPFPFSGLKSACLFTNETMAAKLCVFKL